MVQLPADEVGWWWVAGSGVFGCDDVRGQRFALDANTGPDFGRLHRTINVVFQH